MKIICVDNFNREIVDDKLIADNLCGFYGRDIVDFLNDKFSGDNSPDFYRLVDDDYELFTLEP